MKRILISFVLLFCSLSGVFADDFFPYGETNENMYYDTLGYGIGELLESGKCPSCVGYNVEDVYGSKSDDILLETDIDDITEQDYKYGLVRLHGLYDEIALPPYSSVDFLYWSKNMAGQEVNISAIKVFLSRKYSYLGDLRNVLYIDGVYESLPIKYIVWEYPREGVVKTYEGLGLIADGEGIVDGMRLDTAYVKSPLLFVKWEAEEIKEGVLVRVYVRNESDEILKDTVYTHREYLETRDYLANQEQVYEYVVDIAENGSLGYPGIYNPNIKKECVVRGEHMESNYVGDSPIVGGIREQDGGFLAYIGSRVKPYGYRFCVTRIPYTVYSSEIFLEVENETEEAEIVKVEQAPSDVLGVQELPKTAV